MCISNQASRFFSSPLPFSWNILVDDADRPCGRNKAGDDAERYDGDKSHAMHSTGLRTCDPGGYQIFRTNFAVPWSYFEHDIEPS